MSQNLVPKRQNIARNAIDLSTQLVNAINGLLALKDERAKLGQDFQDTDFVGTGLEQCTAGMIGTLFDFVVPSLQTNYEDAGNGARNKQILLQVRK